MPDLESRVSRLENSYHQVEISATRTEGKIDTILATIKGLQGSNYMTETRVENMIAKILVKAQHDCHAQFITKDSLLTLLAEYFRENPVVSEKEFDGKWNEAHKATQTFWSKMAFGIIGAVATIIGVIFSLLANLSQHIH